MALRSLLPPDPLPPPSGDRLPREVWVLSVVAFLVSLGFGVLYPVLPVFARTFGVSNLLAGLVVSVFAGVRLVTSPIAGRLSHRMDERTMLVVGVGIVAASSAAAGLAGSFFELVLWRGLGGIGSALFSISSMAMLLALAPSHMRGRASGLYSGGFLLGGMAGPAVGGLLTAISLQAPFFFYAGTLAASAAVARWMLPRGIVARASDADPVRVGFVAALGDPRYRAVTLSSFAHGWQSHGVRSLMVPLLVVEGLGMAPRWTGIAFAIAASVQALALQGAGRVVDAPRPPGRGGGVGENVFGGSRQVLVLGSLVTALVGAVLAWAPHYAVIVVLLCVYGVGASLCSTSSTAALGDAVGRGGGTAIAGYQMAADVGTICGPLAAGFLADRVSVPSAFAAGAVLLVLCAILAARMDGGATPSSSGIFGRT